jgi:hypothetical protein
MASLLTLSTPPLQQSVLQPTVAHISGPSGNSIPYGPALARRRANIASLASRILKDACQAIIRIGLARRKPPSSPLLEGRRKKSKLREINSLKYLQRRLYGR